MKIVLTEPEMQQVLDGDYEKGEFCKHHRHNGGDQDIIFEKGGKHFRTTYTWFEDGGIYWEGQYEATEVVKAEKVVSYWKAVD